MVRFDYIRDPAEAERLISGFREEKSLAFDQETTGLDPHVDKVVLAQLSSRTKTALFDCRDPRMLQVLRPVLEDENIAKLGVNLAFDYMAAKGSGGFDTEGNWDLMFAEQLMTRGLQKDGFGLEDITLKYLKKQRDKSLQKSFIGHKGEFSQAQLEYAAEDTADLHPLFDEMRKPLEREGLQKVWGIENRALPAFADIQFYGNKIDVPAWQKIMADNQVIFDRQTLALDKHFEQVYTRDLFGHLDVNYKSQPQILYGLQMLGIEVDGETIKDTSKDTQKKVMHLPVIIELEKYRKAKRALEAYGQNFIDLIHPITGRIHPRIFQIGTDTSRPAGAGGYNPFSIPREKRYRHAFITDSGRLILTVDYSGAELRIVADMSNDPLTVAGFIAGVDFHCYVAAMLFGRDKVEKDDPIRQPTKELNLGLSYGMGPHKLYAKLVGNGVKITLDECFDLFKKYKEKFKVTMSWLEAQRRIASSEYVMTNYAGRKRWWRKPNESWVRKQVWAEALKKAKGRPLSPREEDALVLETQDKLKGQKASIEREGGNFLPQSGNVEWTKGAMYTIRKECKRRGYDARMYNSVYDEIVLDCAEKDAPEVFELQKKLMIEEGQKYMKRVPVGVEGHMMKCWTK